MFKSNYKSNIWWLPLLVYSKHIKWNTAAWHTDCNDW